MERENVTVFTAQIARHLLKHGYTITDIKPDKTDKEHKRSLFVFKNAEGLEEEIKTLVNERKKKEA